MELTSGPFQTLLVEQRGKWLTLRLHRPAAHNAINLLLLQELHAALDAAEASEVRAIILAGAADVFCTGLDFGGLETDPAAPDAIESAAQLYFRLLRRFCASSKLIVSKIEGRVEAGGIGLVAASDVALASPHATFRLPETLLGLIPANVLPFLLRRMTPHQAFWLALTAQRLTAEQAQAIGLLDQVAHDPDDALRRLLLRLDHLPPPALAKLKQLVLHLAPLDPATESLVGGQIGALLRDPASLQRVQALMAHGLWQAGE